jgi:uncharacterized protein YneF (UPF0154 family)
MNGLVLGVIVGFIAGAYLAQTSFEKQFTRLSVDRSHKSDRG